MAVIVLEGAPCAGKSTLRRHLEQCLDNSVLFLPTEEQVRAYMKEMPPFPTHYEGAIRNQRWFLRKEGEKLSLAREHVSRGGHVVAERDYASCLAFSYAYLRTTCAAIVDQPFREYQEHLADGRLCKPDLRIILDITAASMRIRDKKRSKKLNSFWLENGFADHLTGYFRTFASDVEDECSVVVTTQNGEVEEMLRIGTDLVRRLL